MPKQAKRGRPKTLTQEQRKANQLASISKWKQGHVTSVTLMLLKEKDADIILWLESHKPKQRYIRDLIRRDMEDKGD